LKKKKDLNILIIDDHLIIRNGFKTMLSNLDFMYTIKVFEAENAKTAISKLKTKPIELVFLDYNLENTTGPEVLQQLLQLKPKLKVIALSNYDELIFVNYMIEKGAKGYLIKNISQHQLKDAILTVLNNEKYFSTEVLIKMIQKDQLTKTNIVKIKTLLSKREIQVLQLISLELTNEEIAEKLFLSKRTVDSHRHNLLAKLNVKNTVGLIKYAIKYKLV
jgi:DNA-binding NarL/FixJ family response regulator